MGDRAGARSVGGTAMARMQGGWVRMRPRIRPEYPRAVIPSGAGDPHA